MHKTDGQENLSNLISQPTSAFVHLITLTHVITQKLQSKATTCKMNNFSYISIDNGSYLSDWEVDDVGRANDNDCHNELDHKTKAIFERLQTNIEEDVRNIVFCVFSSIFDNFNSVLKGAGIVIRFK